MKKSNEEIVREIKKNISKSKENILEQNIAMLDILHEVKILLDLIQENKDLQLQVYKATTQLERAVKDITVYPND